MDEGLLGGDVANAPQQWGKGDPSQEADICLRKRQGKHKPTEKSRGEACDPIHEEQHCTAMKGEEKDGEPILTRGFILPADANLPRPNYGGPRPPARY